MFIESPAVSGQSFSTILMVRPLRQTVVLFVLHKESFVGVDCVILSRLKLEVSLAEVDLCELLAA